MTYAIPVLDLENVQLEAVRAGTRELGAVQVVNHGVPAGLSEDLARRMARLLSLPRAEKERLASPHPYRGWRQWPDDFGRLELERFNVAQFDGVAEASAAGVGEEYLGLYAHANLWPGDDPGLAETARAYMDACRGLAERMLRLYERAWGLGEDALALGRLPHFRLTVNDYPTWTYPEPSGNSDDDKLLLLEHADDSAVTILAQQGDYEGLQIQAPDGTWLPVPLRPGALQVFSGTLLTRRTGGRLRPGRHRVVAGGTVTRRSTAVFVYPALETVVEPLTPGLEPVRVWDHVKDRVADYLAAYGRPEQVAAWRDGTPYVADLAENSAGR
ncbi:MAG TPA: 2OG-Fe(II) oxygenase family protein [Streptosporangiaceae bacterium]|jgi:flavonol synthase|nr:2OG-Fe(II) oxygenase family protein [Streptosporangiaceae bacterium]